MLRAQNPKALIQRRKGSRTSCQRGSESIERRLQDRGDGRRAHENPSKECPKGNKCRRDGYLSGNAPSNTRTAAPLTRGTSFLPLVETSTSILLGRPISTPWRILSVWPGESLPCLTR